VDVLDSTSGQLLASRSISNFGDGQYLLFEVTANVTFGVTRTAGSNAVLSGLFN